MDVARNWGIELYSDEASIVRHNTLIWHPPSYAQFPNDGGTGQIDIDRKSQDPAGHGTKVDDNHRRPTLISAMAPPAVIRQRKRRAGGVRGAARQVLRLRSQLPLARWDQGCLGWLGRRRSHQADTTATVLSEGGGPGSRLRFIVHAAVSAPPRPLGVSKGLKRNPRFRQRPRWWPLTLPVRA